MLRFTKLLAILLISSIVFVACTLGDNAGGGGSSDPGFQGVPQINYANYTLSFDPNTDVIQSNFKNGSNQNTKPSGLVLSPDGRFLFVSERGPTGDAAGTPDGAVVVMSRNVNTGALTFLQRYSDNTTGGGSGTIALREANRAAVSPDGKYLYVPSRKGSTVMVFSINQNTGALTPIQKVTTTVGVYVVRLTPDGTQALVSGTGKGILIYDRDKSTGMLTEPTTTPAFTSFGGGGSLDNLVSYLVINSAGTHVYVIATALTASGGPWMAFVKRDVDTKIMTVEQQYRNGATSGGKTITGLAATPEAILLSHDEKTLYVGGQGDALLIFDVNPATGELTYKETIANGDTIKDKDGNDITLTDFDLTIDIQESAGGNKLYVAAHDGSAIFTFDRNTSTGDLTFNNKIKNDTHFAGVFTLFISPNGQYIYASMKGHDTDASKPGGIAILNYK